MPSLYYKKEFEIGDGKRMGTMFIDSCLMLCSNYSYADGVSSDTYPNDPTCDETTREWGNI